MAATLKRKDNKKEAAAKSTGLRKNMSKCEGSTTLLANKKAIKKKNQQ
jgi:hypothetical protein